MGPLNRFLFPVISIYLLRFPLWAWAGGIEGPGVGARALSMGGAYVALVDDWTAAFWNPAGLAFMRGWGYGIDVDFISIGMMDNASVNNPIPPLTRSDIQQGPAFVQLGGEPTRFNVMEAKIQAALPSVAGYKTWERWAFSMGVFAPLGSALDFNDNTVPGMRVDYESQSFILNYNVSAAWRWNDRFAMGVGLNVLDATVSNEANKQTTTYAYRSSGEAKGYALQGVIGLMARLSDKMSMGATYKTSANIPLHGSASVSDSRFPLTVPGFGTLRNESSDMTTVFHNPAIYMAGFAFFPTKNVTLTTDWEGTDWTPMRVESRFDQPGVILQDQNFNAGWRFTHRAKAGAEYKRHYQPRKHVAFRGGYMWDPYAIPAEAESLTNFVDTNRNYYFVGVGWRINNWEPGIGFCYDSGSRAADGIEYKRVDRLLTVGFHYHHE